MIVTLLRVTAAENRTRLMAFFGLLLRGSMAQVILPFYLEARMTEERSRRWAQIVDQVVTEYQALAESEKDWIAVRLEQIGRLQGELQQLFYLGNGAEHCCSCLGECCHKGHNHMTLVNLLAYLAAGERPPQPDFTRTCPFLSASGCLLDEARRPYNCVTFICDMIEDSLSAEQVESFYQLDRQLRELYQQFSLRYAGAGMSGLLLQQRRLDGKPFLGAPGTL